MTCGWVSWTAWVVKRRAWPSFLLCWQLCASHSNWHAVPDHWGLVCLLPPLPLPCLPDYSPILLAVLGDPTQGVGLPALCTSFSNSPPALGSPRQSEVSAGRLTVTTSHKILVCGSHWVFCFYNHLATWKTQIFFYGDQSIQPCCGQYRIDHETFFVVA